MNLATLLTLLKLMAEHLKNKLKIVQKAIDDAKNNDKNAPLFSLKAERMGEQILSKQYEHIVNLKEKQSLEIGENLAQIGDYDNMLKESQDHLIALDQLPIDDTLKGELTAEERFQIKLITAQKSEAERQLENKQEKLEQLNEELFELSKLLQKQEPKESFLQNNPYSQLTNELFDLIYLNKFTEVFISDLSRLLKSSSSSKPLVLPGRYSVFANIMLGHKEYLQNDHVEALNGLQM